MQIVINIDEDTYKDIKKGKVYSSIRDVPQESVLAIANGTPLPKGHGRLIDADALMQLAQNCVTKTVDCNDIARFPTIIKAESEETEIIKCHGKQITVPKGTFEKIMNDNEDEESEVNNG